MTFLSDLRSERKELGVSLDLIGALSGVSASALSKAERGLLQPSPAAVRAVLATLTTLQTLRMKFDEIPLCHRDIMWIRKQIEAMNDGRDAAAIKAAGEASDSKRTKRIRPTSGKSQRASAK